MMHNLFRRLIAWIGVLVCLGAVPAAQALLVVGDSGAGSIYTNSAGAGTGWNHVGSVVGNNSSVTYVGNGWFMTANHVWGNLGYAGTVSLGENSYGVADGSYVNMTNSNGSAADLCMFRADDLNGLPEDIALASTPSRTADTFLIGNGLDNDAQVGLTWGDGSLYVDKGQVFTDDFSDTSAIYTTTCFASIYYSDLAGSAYGQTYDSGGGVFQNDELAGIMIMIGTGVGDGITFVTHLDPYMNQINATLAIPEPATFELLVGVGAAALAVRRWFLI